MQFTDSLTEEQKTELATVLSPEEVRGAISVHITPNIYAASAFSIWRRENPQYVGDAAIAAFKRQRSEALATMRGIPSDSLALLRCTEGVDPLAIAKRWHLIGQARGPARRF
jgi:hypothetical protein